MSAFKTISVIVPVYNVEQYLNKCMEHIYRQTYPMLEIILVDDGSTDQSGSICDALAAQHENTIVIHKANGGLSSARNAGLSCATGDYCLFIDSDDYMTEDMIEQLYEAQIKTDSDWAVCGYRKVDENGTELSRTSLKDEIINISEETEKFQFLLHRFLEYEITWEAWNKLYNRRLIEKYHLEFQPNVEVFSEDICFNTQYLLYCNQIIVCSNCCYNYVQRQNSIMGKNQNCIHLKEHLQLAKKVYGTITERGYGKMKQHFAPIFHMLMNTEYYKLERMEPERFGQEVTAVGKDEFFLQYTQQLLKDWRWLIDAYNIEGAMKKLKLTRRLLLASGHDAVIPHGKCMLHQKLLVIRNCVQHMKRKLAQPRRKIYLIGTEDFGNLGDHMIAEAELQYLGEHYPTDQICELTASGFAEEWEAFRRKIQKDSPIYLTGGGNMGNEYMVAEQIRCRVIQDCPENVITIFPQTIYYTGDAKGQAELEESRRIYNGHKHLTIIAREQYSESFAKKYFTGRVSLQPDMVLGYHGDMISKPQERKGILLCMRSDKEGVLGTDALAAIQRKIHQSGRLCMQSETQKHYCIQLTERKKALQDYLQLVQRSELVVTDRLHGMIFSVITHTPCIVFSNYNYKIRGCYEGLQDKTNVQFAESAEDFAAAYELWCAGNSEQSDVRMDKTTVEGHMKTKIKLDFSDFWGGFNKTDNYWYKLLSREFEIEITDQPDFLIYSTFGRDYLNYDCVKIFYTGENVRPDFNQCDYGIGFDYMQFEDRYFRYPIYMLYRKSWELALHKHEITEEDLQKKTGFCNFIYSNPYTQTERDAFFQKLSEYKRVDSGGRYLNNIGGPVEDKVAWQSHYKFSIAFENSIQSGYQTEKLIEAYAAKTIPIYMGNPRVLTEMNPDSLIVCERIEDFDRVMEQVKAIDQNDALFQQMLRTPMLLNQEQYEAACSEEKLAEFLRNIFMQGKEAAERKHNYNFGTFTERDLKIAERAKQHERIGRMFGILEPEKK